MVRAVGEEGFYCLAGESVGNVLEERILFWNGKVGDPWVDTNIKLGFEMTSFAFVMAVKLDSESFLCCTDNN